MKDKIMKKNKEEKENDKELDKAAKELVPEAAGSIDE